MRFYTCEHTHYCGIDLHARTTHLCTLDAKAKNDRIDAYKIATLLQAHVQHAHHQYNMAAPGARISYKANREGVAEHFSDPSARMMVEADFEIMGA
jgi:hypothetical protein